MVALNDMEAKTIKMKLLDEQVVVAAETNTYHKEGVAAGNSKATEGAPQGGGLGSIMEVGSQQQASQIHPHYGRHQFVPQLVTESMIEEH